MKANMQHNTLSRRIGVALSGLSMLALAGCHQDMWNQPRYTALQENGFFADNMASRPLVDGTVPYNDPRIDDHYYTGKVNGDYAQDFPVQIVEQDTLTVLKRGQERYNIYCSPCHGFTGDGNGMIVQRGMKQATSYHIAKFKDPAQVTSRPGYFFDVITNGFGVMYGYATRIPVEDRWAIAAYIQALQLSQEATTADLPEDELRKLLHPEAQTEEAHGNGHGEH